MSPEADSRLWRDRVQVMVEDIDRIMAFIGGMTRDAFGADEKAVFAVCYGFVRLGEAVPHIPDHVRDAHPEVEWIDIRKFRNFMIHVYLAVDPGRLYDTAKADLPLLAAKLRAILVGGD